MSTDILVVLGILAGAIILFVSNKLRPDVVALLTVLALLLSRALNLTEALSGFANPAVITIAIIFVITAGLTNTGVASHLGEYLFRIAGKNEARLIAVTMGTSAILSLIMNNIASASVLLPGLNSISRKSGISPSKLMMPLSFGTLLGGMATLFTTMNLLANDALRRNGLAPFSFWDYFRIGSILSIVGIAFMAILGRKLLPNYEVEIKTLPQNGEDTFGEIRRPDKAPWALIGISLMLLMAGFGIMPIAAAALLGALVMVLSGVLKIDEGYQAIEWKAVIMVGGMLSLGTALSKSGAADLISHSFLHLLDPLGVAALPAGFFLISLLIAQILSGAATTVLLSPIALGAAVQMHVNPHPVIMMMVLGSSSGFLTPVSHPANVLVMGPGGYKFGDYARVGFCLSLILFLLATILVPRFWPL
jgi:solute carrier family 13 (sodium-dependent dicarboxylate transporter), member 2/3/5